MGHQIIFGTSVLINSPPTIRKPLFTYPGKAMSGETGFGIDENLMSRHVLLLGGAGCGKTNAFCYTVSQLRDKMAPDRKSVV